MKNVKLKIYFKDEEYYELEKLAERLEISTKDLICEFMNEGMSLLWGEFEHEAKKKDKIRAISEKCDVPVEKIKEITEYLNK